MRRYLAVRLAQLVITLLALSVLIFGLVRAAGDPAALMLDPSSTPRDYELIRQDLGLDQSIPVQYWKFISRAVQGDLGKVTAPVLLFRSQTDHVVDPSSAATIIRDIGSHDVREVMLKSSYHVATLDYDAQEIFAGCAGFIASLVGR